jgi:hypothetical protein
MYSRPLAPEMTTGEPYNPFKTDVWQLGISFTMDFQVRKFSSLLSLGFLTTSQTTISGIDQVLEEMTLADPVARLSAHEALEKLGSVINAVTPTSLLIEPVILQNP